MSNLTKYIVTEPSPEDLVEIKSALVKSDEFVSEIILSADEIATTNGKIERLIKTANQQKDNKVGLFSGKKTAIESLQMLAEFQADTIQDLWNYQKLVFEQFTKLSETSNKLLFLGVANAAVTRAVIDQLKTKTSKPLSEDARRHLLNVIKDLERQADAQDRINRLRDKTSSAIQNESQNRKTDIGAVYTFIEDGKKSIIALISNETQKRSEAIHEISGVLNDIKGKYALSSSLKQEAKERADAIRKLNDALNRFQEMYALESSLSQEHKERVQAIEELKSVITDANNKLTSYNDSIAQSIQKESEIHYAKEEQLHNEIAHLKSRNKISIWIGIAACLLYALLVITIVIL